MSNFFRVVCLSLRYRVTVVAAVLCALAIGVLWGGNIGTVFPFVEVVFRGQSLGEWVDGEIQKSANKITELDNEIAELRASGEDSGRHYQVLSTRRQAEQAAEATYHRLRPFIHRYLPNDPFQTLILVVAILFFGTLIKDVFLAASTVLTERLAQSGTTMLRKQLFNQTLRMPLAQLQQDDSSQWMSRLTFDVEQITIGLRSLFGRTIREPLKMAVCFVGAAIICWRLLLISLILAPMAAFAISVLNKMLKRANSRALEEMTRIYSVLADTLRGLKTVKAYTMESIERRRFDESARRYFHRAMRVSMFDAMVRPSIEMMGIGVICIAILGGAYLVLNEETHLLGIRVSERPLSISSMMLFFGFLAGVSDPARKLSGVIGKLQRAAAAADRVYEIVSQQSVLPKAQHAVDTEPHQRDIQLDQVSFAFTEGQPVLRDITLQIPAGETIALVGPNGCGKSTLGNLLLRFFDPTQGSVRIDGVDLRDMRLRDLRRQIGLVTQDAFLFNDTIEANIRFGRPGATREEIEEVAKRALAHDFILEQLPYGYETPVGESACRLSGGQRQRIAIARAILKDPSILILDEATSQFDLESEHQIHKVLARFIKDRTTIIITHRQSILELTDRVVVMENGRIVDVGSHAQLMARSNAFQRLSLHSKLSA